MKNKLNLIELTDYESESKITVNAEKINYIFNMGNKTLIAFNGYNITVKDNYESIQSLLNQIV